MIFTVLGGDFRSVYLVRRLWADGHTVRSFGLELADIPPQCRSHSLQHATAGAQCVILPTPAADGALLRTPFGATPITIDAVAAAIPHGARVFGGMLSLPLREALAARGLHIVDLLSIEAMAIKNAALTAQCALQLIAEQLPCTLSGQPMLILGAGRIGKLLGLQLQAVGTQVTVASRSKTDQAWCAALGLTPADITNLVPILPRCPTIINTVPARILDKTLLQLLPQGALLVELASAPGGFDGVVAESMGLQTVHGGGLPGKYAPQSAADAIADIIYEEIKR